MESTFIKVYDKVLSDDLCDRLMNFFDSEEASIKYLRFNTDHRRANELTIPHPDLPASHSLAQEVNKVLKEATNQYKKDIFDQTGWNTVHMCNRIEALKMVRYDPSPETPYGFGNHVDAWNSDSASRQISIIIYLSDVEEGGSTTFDYFKLPVQPKKGRVLAFPSAWPYTHRGEAPISDSKYIMVTWLHFDGATGYHTAPL